MVPPGNKQMLQHDEMYPRTKTRAEDVTDSDVSLITIGRLVKSAWSRVYHTPTRTRPSTAQNGGSSAVSEQTLDATNKELSEREMELERQRTNSASHEDTVKTKQMPSIDENEPLDVITGSNASIRLKFKKPMLVRSVSEPSRKTTSVASTFRGR